MTLAAISVALCTCDDITGFDSIEDLWFRPLAEQTTFSTMAAGDDAFFYLGFGDAVAVDAGTGSVRWTSDVPVGFVPRNLTFADGLVLGAADQAFALDARSGELRWVTPLPASASLASTDAGNGMMAMVTSSLQIHVLDLLTGATVWNSPLGIDAPFEVVPRTLRIIGDAVYVGGKENLNQQGGRAAGWLLALDLETGNRRWLTRFMSADSFHSIHDGPVQASGRLLVNDFFANTVHAVDAVTGAILWSRQGRYPAVGAGNAPAVSGGMAYVASGDTFLYGIEVASGLARWKVGMEESLDDAVLCGDFLVVSGLAVSAHDRDTGRRLGYMIEHGDEHYAVGPAVVLDGIVALPVDGGVRAFRCA